MNEESKKEIIVMLSMWLRLTKELGRQDSYRLVDKYFSIIYHCKTTILAGIFCILK